MHRECGFIRLKPDTNKVAFISAQNTGTASLGKRGALVLLCLSSLFLFSSFFSFIFTVGLASPSCC